MIRKDASGFRSNDPVVQHRKQIGKHDWRKSRLEVKAQKRAVDQKYNMWFLMVLGLITMLCLLGGLYGFLYWYLDDAFPSIF